MAKTAKKDATPSSESRASIIATVTTPLGLLALIALIIEAMLAAFAVRAQGQDFTILVYGMLASLLMFLAIVGGVLAFRPQALGPAAPSLLQAPVVPAKLKYDFDVFLSAPMAAFATEAAYAAGRADVLRVMAALKEHLDLERVYFAGETIESIAGFDAMAVAVEEDLDKIRNSRIFVMLYPVKIVSSVLVEAGYALALRRPTLIFVRDLADLPFLLRNAAEVLHYVRVVVEPDTPAILARLKKNGIKLIPAA